MIEDDVSLAPGTTVYYYCPAANAFYPSVQYCPDGWQLILASPPAP